MYSSNEEHDYDFNREDFDSFVRSLRERDPGGLDSILMRYSLYRPEMAEAALLVACEKGLFGYDLYEKLLEYVRINFAQIAPAAKELRWSRDNAFRAYVKTYSDDRLFDILEDRSDIVKDVYLAILDESVERGLIEPGEKDRLFRELRNSEKTFFQRRREIREEVFNDIFFPRKEKPEKQKEKEEEKYWTCPACREQVGMNLAVCWNCGTADPDAEKTE